MFKKCSSLCRLALAMDFMGGDRAHRPFICDCIALADAQQLPRCSAI